MAVYRSAINSLKIDGAGGGSRTLMDARPAGFGERKQSPVPLFIHPFINPKNSGVVIMLPIFHLCSRGLSVSINVSIVNKV
jgi:hypothetical protein